MTVIQGLVVAGRLFGAHYICHQGAEGERVSLGPAPRLPSQVYKRRFPQRENAERKNDPKRGEERSLGRRVTRPLKSSSVRFKQALLFSTNLLSVSRRRHFHLLLIKMASNETSFCCRRRSRPRPSAAVRDTNDRLEINSRNKRKWDFLRATGWNFTESTNTFFTNDLFMTSCWAEGERQILRYGS